MIVSLQDERLRLWAGQRLGLEFGPHCRTLANADKDGLLCVVVYSHVTAYDCQMSIASASQKWCQRHFLSAAFDYPFVQLGLCRVSFLTAVSNARTVRLLERLGAKQEGRIRRAFGDEDGYLFGLLPEERRF
jgi:hypothetical protein